MEKLNLVEILKDCPKGTKLYSTIYGEVELVRVIEGDNYPIRFMFKDTCERAATKEGCHLTVGKGECTLFPSKEQRDWSKFKIKKERFDPATLKPFDKVLVRDSDEMIWDSNFFGHIKYVNEAVIYQCMCEPWYYCIPFNEETEHLIGKKEKAPEFYRYWEE